MKKKRTGSGLSLLISGLLLFVLSACEIPGTKPGTGLFKAHAGNDKPIYSAVYISIDSVMVHQNPEADETDGEWITLNAEPVVVDLVSLTNGTRLLGHKELQPGKYTQLRLMLGDNNEVEVNGEILPLDTPGAQETGIKLLINVDIEEGAVYNLLLAFDASRSVVQAGNPNHGEPKYILKPVIRTVKMEEAGAITGTANPAEALPQITLVTAEDTIATGLANSTGTFILSGIPSGQYTIHFNPVEGFTAVILENVRVEPADTTDLGVIQFESAANDE